MTVQMTQTSAVERGMQLDELLALPVAFDLETANRALCVGRTKGFELARRGEYPCPLMRVGRTYRVTRAALLHTLGIEAGNGDGAGVAPPTPLAEHVTEATA